jgi:hypothetical protein
MFDRPTVGYFACRSCMPPNYLPPHTDSSRAVLSAGKHSGPRSRRRARDGATHRARTCVPTSDREQAEINSTNKNTGTIRRVVDAAAAVVACRSTVAIGCLPAAMT